MPTVDQSTSDVTSRTAATSSSHSFICKRSIKSHAFKLNPKDLFLLRQRQMRESDKVGGVSVTFGGVVWTYEWQVMWLSWAGEEEICSLSRWKHIWEKGGSGRGGGVDFPACPPGTLRCRPAMRFTKLAVSALGTQRRLSWPRRLSC